MTMTTIKYRKILPLVGLVIVTFISIIEAECNHCPPITPKRGVALTCKNSNGVTIDCSSPSPPFTTINYRCRSFYRPLQRDAPIHGQIQCSQSCTWENIRRLEELTCEIDCGKPSQPHVTFLVEGEKALRYSWPWHAAIFVQDQKTLQHQYICGGTLISEHAVLTAAHCLITRQQFLEDSYHIVLGAYSSNWTENIGDHYAQFFKIMRSHVPDEYDEVEVRSDIGIVELDHPIALSEAVSPACFPYDGDFSKPQEPVVVGEGEVVGYGKNEHGDYEVYLKYARLPVLGATKCYEILDKLPGREQFCAGLQNGSTTCNGDSGGGMVFKGQGMSRYYVQGIVSHGRPKKDLSTCHGPTYFTNVLHFSKWVTDILKPAWIPPPIRPLNPPPSFDGKTGECTNRKNMMEEGAGCRVNCRFRNGTVILLRNKADHSRCNLFITSVFKFGYCCNGECGKQNISQRNPMPPRIDDTWYQTLSMDLSLAERGLESNRQPEYYSISFNGEINTPSSRYPMSSCT